MAAKWIGFSLFLYIVGFLIANLLTGYTMTTPVDTIKTIVAYRVVTSEESIGAFSFITTLTGYFSAIWNVITLNLPLFGDDTSPLQWIRYICFFPLAGTMVYGMAMSLISIFYYTLKGGT